MVVSIGAFYAGCPVQPVSLKYPNRLVSEKYCKLNFKGGVYMALGQLLHWHMFIPVPSCGSVFVYMIPP